MIDTNLVVEYPNCMDLETCNKIIKKFDDEGQGVPGITGAGVYETVKKSTDLVISILDHWNEYDDIVFNVVTDKCYDHIAVLKKSWHLLFNLDDVVDSGYQIQKTVPGGFYHWHDDGGGFINNLEVQNNGTNVYIESFRRISTFILYLNTIDSDTNGGRTQFYMGEDEEPYSVTPEAGKLLFFPANEAFPHRGETLTGGCPKYLITGWISYSTPISYDGPLH